MSDQVIWDIIDKSFCAFKFKTDKNKTFCRNEFNVSGMCDRKSCPLANAQYATVKNIEGRLYLYMKTAERAHTPNRLWERIKLSRNYKRALKQIDQNLIYWDKFLINKCKQRLTRLTQVMIQERRMALNPDERRMVGVRHKVLNRERSRERKALVAAKIERAIEKELMDRLKSGAYGDQPLNVDEKVWRKILGKLPAQAEEEEEDDEEFELESGDEEDVGKVEYVEMEDEEEDDAMVEMEDLEKWLGADSDDDDDDDDDDHVPTAKTSKPRLEIEIEEEPMINLAEA